MKMPPLACMIRKHRLFLAGTVVALAAFLIGTNGWMVAQANPRLYSQAASIPANRAALVLGCRPGSVYFQWRIEAAAELWHAGKARYLIVSGDNHLQSYNEPEEMKAALIWRGVPANRIYCDYAGFRTLDSVIRAKAIFGQDRLTIVSQPYHNCRALAIARHHGIAAIGFNARDWRRPWWRPVPPREWLARPVAWADLYLWHRNPKFYGPAIVLPETPLWAFCQP
jgi:vancomycin permeability regulator SanA